MNIDLSEYKDYDVYLFKRIGSPTVCIIVYDFEKRKQCTIYMSGNIKEATKRDKEDILGKWGSGGMYSEGYMLKFFERQWQITKVTNDNIKEKLFLASL